MAPTKADLEKKIKERDKTIANLRLEKSEQSLLIKQLQLTMNSLQQRIDTLEAASPAPPPPQPEEPEVTVDKIHYDCAVLSDSIFRHVCKELPKVPPLHIFNKATKDVYLDMKKALKTDFPLLFPGSLGNNDVVPGVKCMKIVVPGAGPARLVSELFEISQTHTFSEIIIHCGTNLLPDQRLSNTVIADEIRLLLATAKRIFPSATITYSPILPKSNWDEQKDPHSPLHDFTRMNLNNLVIRSSECPNVLLCPAFMSPATGEFKLQLAADGTHLNETGIESMRESLTEHITARHSRDDRYFSKDENGEYVR